MASAEMRDELDCSICLTLFTDPVTLRCGHSFCQICIDQMMDTQDASGVYSCPECRDKFRERPALQKNITLCKIVGNFLQIHPPREVAKIFCTHCEESPAPAVKSCLHCEASLCDKHLRVHSNSAEHVLSEPSTSLESRKCPVHKKILEYYCTEDDSCVCMSCCLRGDHQGHRVENLVEVSERKKEKLRNVLRILNSKLQHLDSKKHELCRKIRHIEELCDMGNPVTVLQEPDGCEVEDEDGEQLLNMAVVTGTFHEELLPFLVSKHGDKDGMIHPPEPANLSLDTRTAANELRITGNQKIATRTFTDLNRPWDMERFMHYQVLSTKSFSSGRHYWDVDIGRSSVWMVGMCYPSIARSGTRSIIGSNNKSWGLHGYKGNGKHAVRHNNKVIELPRQLTSNRFRVCVNYEAGHLSFYELCDPPIRHIYTFTATFTEPLHAILCVCNGSVRIVD